MRGKKNSIKKFEEIRDLLKLEKDQRIKQKLSFLYLLEPMDRSAKAADAIEKSLGEKVEQGKICLFPRIKEEDHLSSLLKRKSLISWTTKKGDYQLCQKGQMLRD
ncbi:MAG: hypothetical protein OCU22_09875, partial [Canidatus Methanoxibalbensis ujae]|nr:hypothetical protein [Candidatus Methanoxibalbensis ujae]